MKPEISYVYEVKKVIRCIDGDTVELMIDLGFSTYETHIFRLIHINTYEMRGPNKEKGIKAKERLEELLSSESLVIQTFKNNRGARDKRGSFGRYLCEIYSSNESIPINQILFNEGHAVPYVD